MTFLEPFPEDGLALCERLDLGAEIGHEGPIVPRDKLLEFARTLREDLGYAFFVTCCATHFPATEDDGEHCVVAYRVRFLGSPTRTLGFRVKVPHGESSPSLAGLWAGADWQEREQYDLVGVLFADHPDLRRLMMSEDWEGHPLRRDYAIETRHHPWR